MTEQATSATTAAGAPVAGGNAGMHSDYLEVRGLSVEFDGFTAVSNVDLTLFQGDLRFLIGPNGAGKTTMIDAITGLVPATGSVQKSGVELLGKKVHQIARLGVGRTFQTASVFEELSVLQNLDIAAGAGRSIWTMLRRRPVEVSASIEQALETIGLTALRDKPAGTLAHGQKQWLEIGMLLVQDASVLLLDEPVAGMSQEEREETGNLLRRIGGERTVVVVEHDMDFMRNFATSVTVLARGAVLAEGSVAEVQADPAVQEAYLGTAAAAGEEDPTGSAPEPVAPGNRVAPSVGPEEHRPSDSSPEAGAQRDHTGPALGRNGQGG
ncbi:urea ABC transporter ATP-binding protein UrtD [Nocardia jinanensis]|uniref:ABC transporter ATP-binding protein n=1 Tax=Nocardia jinanensis TaxID=382504 RepID=A0A917VMR5_9NOCA|nr:urea ABC transporter ATP-binding protein UrtD [Nocardia jinanensis]GGK96912.1 ABC transporter ATP-binding protein [Nocardia jinanensis]